MSLTLPSLPIPPKKQGSMKLLQDKISTFLANFCWLKSRLRQEKWRILATIQRHNAISRPCPKEKIWVWVGEIYVCIQYYDKEYLVSSMGRMWGPFVCCITLPLLLLPTLSHVSQSQICQRIKDYLRREKVIICWNIIGDIIYVQCWEEGCTIIIIRGHSYIT